MAGEQPTVRQRRQAATSIAIERSAVALVLEHGLENVTVDMICEASGVSQRTFFNYFPTKDAAILGTSVPKLDETSVREFIASDDDDLLAGAVSLVLRAPATEGGEPDGDRLAIDRLSVVSRTPALMHKQMERLFAVYREMEDIIYLRMRRTAPPGESADDTREYAAITAALISGVVRLAAERRATGSDDEPLLGSARMARTMMLLSRLPSRLAAR